MLLGTNGEWWTGYTILVDSANLVWDSQVVDSVYPKKTAFGEKLRQYYATFGISASSTTRKTSSGAANIEAMSHTEVARLAAERAPKAGVWAEPASGPPKPAVPARKLAKSQAPTTEGWSEPAKLVFGSWIFCNSARCGDSTSSRSSSKSRSLSPALDRILTLDRTVLQNQAPAEGTAKATARAAEEKKEKKREKI